MCGIAGELRIGRGINERLTAMANALAHRGPDDSGIWSDEAEGIGLAHRRLAIVELSAAGHQPMHSAHGRFVLVFNGEIYNHDALRAELAALGAAPAFRGHSDTETLLAGFECWGLRGTLERARGMFAIAAWERDTRTLTLARDRLGEKPLYVAETATGMVFASELGAIRRHGAIDGRVDRGALALLLRHAYVPAPWTILAGVRKLLPGTMLTIAADGRQVTETYWDARATVAQARATPFDGTPDEAVDALESTLRAAVQEQLMSDMPLGAFLSGGVDSSTIVALMQTGSAQRVRTFTIGFEAAEFDEADHARAVAAHLGTDHRELRVSNQAARDVVPLLPQMYGEPFADSSQIPTYLVSALARQHVTVALSGDGGDELFAGYNRYTAASAASSTLARVPRWLRRPAGAALGALSAETWDALLTPVMAVAPAARRLRRPGDKLLKVAAALGATDTLDLYRRLVSQWPRPADVVLGATESPTALDAPTGLPTGTSAAEQMMLLDLVSYLPDDILAKVDRAAMAVSLETRVPMLDPRVVALAWRLPMDLKLREGVGKWALRQVLYRHVPRTLIERPKWGFAVPLAAWLRGPLRDWADDLLSVESLRADGYFDVTAVRSAWKSHRSGMHDRSAALWCILAFQAWRRTPV